MKKTVSTPTPTVSFYLHPRLAERGKKLRTALKQIAQLELTSMAEVSQALIGYGTHCYNWGMIKFEARPNPALQKMALTWVASQTWERELKDIQPHDSRQRYTLAFRWENDRSSSVINEIAERHAVTPGEVLLTLLEHAVEQYKQGEVSLKATTPEKHFLVVRKN